MKKVEEKPQSKKRFPLETKKTAKNENTKENKPKERPTTKTSRKTVLQKQSNKRKDLSLERINNVNSTDHLKKENKNLLTIDPARNYTLKKTKLNQSETEPKNDIENEKQETNSENNEQEPETPIWYSEDSKYDFNLYKHLKENIKNKEKLCSDGISNESYYCLECKMSTCPKCPLFNVHNGHDLVNKIPYYKLDKEFIDECFKDIDSIFSLNPNYLNVNKVKGELKVQVNTQISNLINELSEAKTLKLKEIDDLFIGTENCVEKLKENENLIKTNLYNFCNEKKNFYCIDLTDSSEINPEANEVLKNLQEGTAAGMIHPNKDNVNTTFLISYDLLKNTEWINNEIKNIIVNIKTNTEKYLNDFNEKSKIIEEDIRKLLEPFESQFKYQYFLCNFYKQINDKISNYSKKINEMKKTVFEKVNKKGGFEDIERENKIFGTEIKQAFENIMNNQVIDEDQATTIRSMMNKARKFRKYGAGASKTPSIMAASKFKGNNNLMNNKDINAPVTKVYDNMDEIKLDKDCLQEYFSFITMNLVKKKYKIKKNNDLDYLNEEFDEDVDLAKPIPNTNEMQVYDRKSKTIIKKQVKFEKKTHKYLYFLNGCRSVLIKDRLYITGGADKENTVTKMAYVYYIKTNELKPLPEMNKPHVYHSVEYLDFYKSIAVIGGENCASCELFDMNVGTWRELPDMKVPRAHCSIYLDKMNDVIYSFFGIIGNITDKDNYTDVLECLELRKLALGWYKIDYNNRAEMNFKSGFNKLLPLNPEMVLIYGAKNMRDFAKKSAVFLIPKQEMIKIDNRIFNEIREASKKSKKLSKVLTSYV